MMSSSSSSDSGDESQPRPSRWTFWRNKRRRRHSDVEEISSNDSLELDESASDNSPRRRDAGRNLHESDSSEQDQSDEAEGSSNQDIDSDQSDGLGVVHAQDRHEFSENGGDADIGQLHSDSGDNNQQSSDDNVIVPGEEDNTAVGVVLPLQQHAAPENIVQQVAPVEETVPLNDTLSEGDEADERNIERNAGNSTDEEDEVWYDSEQSVDSDDYDAAVNEEDELLYPNATLTVMESILTVMTVAIKHRLSGNCITDILELIKVHCPAGNHCVTTLYKLKKYFSTIGTAVLKQHFYCSGCNISLEGKNTVCAECDGGNEVTFFIEIPIKNQILTLMKRPNSYNDLQYRFIRVKQGVNNVEDVYDGQMYKDLFEHDGFLSNPNHLSLFWYTDGIPVYHTSKFQIWPLYFRINELSPTKRAARENTLLAGLWFGPNKINPNLFLNPFHTALNEFQEQGYEVQLPNGGPQICMKGRLLLGVGDLPALSAILRFRQFNGSYGCLNCVSEGQRHVAGGGTVQVYPYTQNIVLRNNNDIPGFAAEALRRRQRDPNAAVYGVKGPSLLFSMVPNMVRCTGKDKMHGIDGGVGKQKLILMTDSMYLNEPFSVRNVIRNVDYRLRKIKPPSFVQRVPCSIEKDLSLWHSQDYRHWLMYYSIPVLFGLLDDVYLQHHCMLVSAVFLLNQLSVSSEQIDAASRMLHLYVSRFQVLYGLRHLGINVHQLLHLPEVVKDLGPLRVYACYSFEDLNGKLKKLIHGTRHAGMQLCSAASTYLNLPVLVSELPEESPAKQFCQKLECKEARVKVADEISPGVHAVGTYFTVNDHEENETRIALQGLGIEGGRLKYFHRLRKHGIMFYSCKYPRDIQKESSYIEFTHNDIPKLGRIQGFFKRTDCGRNCIANCQQCPSMYFFIASVYVKEPWFIHRVPLVRIPYLNKVTPTDEIIVLPITALSSLCFFINVDDNEYIVKPVNLIEGN